MWNFPVLHNAWTESGPPNLIFNGCRGVKRPRREVIDSPPTSVEVKNEWSYTSTPSFVFMTWAGTSVLSVQSKRTVTNQTVLFVCEPYTTHTFMVCGMCVDSKRYCNDCVRLHLETNRPVAFPAQTGCFFVPWSSIERKQLCWGVAIAKTDLMCGDRCARMWRCVVWWVSKDRGAFICSGHADG